MVEPMLYMIRASREVNWMLHLACIRQMLPWCFAYDNTNYAKYMSIYYSDMTSLPKATLKTTMAMPIYRNLG